jgi:hypothetical protein
MTEIPSNYENVMNSVFKKSTILTDIGEKFSVKSNVITSSLTDKIKGNFNKFLDSNPELRMSTSTYARTKLDTEFIPKFEETASIVGNIHICICMHIFIHIYMRIYIYIYICIYVYIYFHLYIYICIQIFLFTNMFF